MRSRVITVNDKMQQNYRYVLSEQSGRNFAPDFKPDLAPKDVLQLGVFSGKYMTDAGDEFPKSWFEDAKLSGGEPEPRLNYFGAAASQPLSIWRKKGWIHPDDPRGWSSGTAATTWVAACPTKTGAKSIAGRRCVGTFFSSSGIAIQAI